MDDVLDDFESGPSLAGPAAAEDFPPAPTKAAPSPPSATVAATGEDEDFPDPEEDALEDEESFAKQAQEGMAAIMNGLGSDEEAEFRTLMAEMMRGGTGGGGMGADGEFDPASFLAALGGDASLFGAAPSKAAATSSSTTGKAKGKSSATTTPAATGSFQDTIASAMNKLKDSSTTVDAEAEAKAASSGSDPLAAMMAQMAGLGEMGGEEGLQGMLDEVMDQLMSRELLYEPLKDLASKVCLFTNLFCLSLRSNEMEKLIEMHLFVAVSRVSLFERSYIVGCGSKALHGAAGDCQLHRCQV